MLKPELSEDAWDLISKLLEWDPTKRLGSGAKGTENIKKHKFFKDLEWDKLYTKSLPAPFIPRVTSNDDISQIDKMFTNELPQETPTESNLNLNQKKRNYYEGFTFKNEDSILSSVEKSPPWKGVVNASIVTTSTVDVR